MFRPDADFSPLFAQTSSSGSPPAHMMHYFAPHRPLFRYPLLIRFSLRSVSPIQLIPPHLILLAVMERSNAVSIYRGDLVRSPYVNTFRHVSAENSQCKPSISLATTMLYPSFLLTLTFSKLAISSATCTSHQRSLERSQSPITCGPRRPMDRHSIVQHSGIK